MVGLYRSVAAHLLLACALVVISERTSRAEGVRFDDAGQGNYHETALDATDCSLCDCCTSCQEARCCGCDDGCLLGPCDWLGRHRCQYDGKKRRKLADKHAPANLMGDHVHHQGQWMFEYKYMNMYMDGNKLGTRKLGDRESINVGIAQFSTNRAATPTRMTMEMHMLHIMYGWNDNVTLYAMPMLSSLTMDHIRGPNNPAVVGNLAPLYSSFTTHDDGFDDLGFGALLRLHSDECRDISFNLGFSAPTGDLDQKSSEPTAGLAELELPYPMRRGSGTFNLRPGITFKRYYNHGSLGAQYQTNLPVGTNDEGYSVGDEHRVNLWYSWLPCDRLAFSYRVEGLWREAYQGADPDLAQPIISTARPDMRGGEWLNFGYGTMLLLGDGYLANVELVHPVYERLNGIQLSNNWWLAASVSKGW
ncbi:MAG: hypothetical protein KDA42_11825 [Planctomycetales bacterium]|nr:hypothetical protein [Planctomycetales bacterium]